MAAVFDWKVNLKCVKLNGLKSKQRFYSPNLMNSKLQTQNFTGRTYLNKNKTNLFENTLELSKNEDFAINTQAKGSDGVTQPGYYSPDVNKNRHDGNTEKAKMISRYQEKKRLISDSSNNTKKTIGSSSGFDMMSHSGYVSHKESNKILVSPVGKMIKSSKEEKKIFDIS